MKGENFNVLLQRARRLRVVLVFVDLPVLALFYFFFFVLFFGFGCAAAPACQLYPVVAILIQQGERLFEEDRR
jgi:hypothetical protein